MNEIRHYTLGELRYFDKAYELQRRMRDEEQYFNGIYTYEAVAIAISNCFREKGKKPLEYRQKPLLWKETEADVRKAREEFVEKLMMMKTNWELSKKGG